jgi:hypothetical protein
MKTTFIIRGSLSYLPVFLFIAITIHHFYLVQNHNLSPWLGGGYGMFSTTDYGPSRFIKSFVLKDNVIQEEIEIPEHLSSLGKRVRSLPDKKNMKNLAVKLEYYLAVNQHSFPIIRVEIWSTRYEPKTLKPTYQKLSTIDHQTTP